MGDPHRPNPRGGLRHAGLRSAPAPANPHRNNPHGGLNQHSGNITGMISGAPPPKAGTSLGDGEAIPHYLRAIDPSQPPTPSTGPQARPRSSVPERGYGGYGGQGGYGPSRPYRPRGGGFTPHPRGPRPQFHARPPPPQQPPESWRANESWRDDRGSRVTSAPEPPKPPPTQSQPAQASESEPPKHGGEEEGMEERGAVEDARAAARQKALLARRPSPPTTATATTTQASNSAQPKEAKKISVKQEPGFEGPSAKKAKSEPMTQKSEIQAKLAAAGLLDKAKKTLPSAPAAPPPASAEAQRLQAQAMANCAAANKEIQSFIGADVKPDKAALDRKIRPGPLKTKDSDYHATLEADSKAGIKVKAEKEDEGYTLKDQYVGGQRIKGERVSGEDAAKLRAQVAQAEAEVDAAQPLGLEEEDPEEAKRKRRAAILERLAKAGDYASAESQQLESEKAAGGVGGAEWEKKLASLLGDDDTEDPDDEEGGDFGRRLDGLLFGAEADEERPYVEKPSRTSKAKRPVIFRSGEMRVLLPKIRRRDYIRCAPNLKLHRIMMNPPDVRIVRLTPEEIHFWTRSQEPFKPIRDEHEYRGLGLEVGLDNSTTSLAHRQREEVRRKQQSLQEQRRRMLELKRMELMSRKGPSATSLLSRSSLPSAVRDSDLPENLRFKKRAQLSGIAKLPSFKKKKDAPKAAPSPTTVNSASNGGGESWRQSQTATAKTSSSMNPLDHMERLSDDEA